MIEHVTAWLGAYHDGELQGRRLQQVEAHLTDCAACRAELADLQAASMLLLEYPSAENLTSPDRFISQVRLQLRPRPDQPAWKRVLETGWRLTPFALLGTWASAQAVLIVASGLLVALGLGLGGDALAGLLPASQSGLWTEVVSFSGASVSEIFWLMLRVFGDGGPFGWIVTLNVLVVVVIGLLYWSWMASWIVRRRRRGLLQ